MNWSGLDGEAAGFVGLTVVAERGEKRDIWWGERTQKERQVFAYWALVKKHELGRKRCASKVKSERKSVCEQDYVWRCEADSAS